MSNIMIKGFFCILHSSYVPGLRPFVLLNEINLLSKKGYIVFIGYGLRSSARYCTGCNNLK
jgi:hypothetical protein